MPRIGHSTSSLVAMNALARNQRAMATAVERLATGKRINRTSDDPAGAAAAAGLDYRRVTLEEVVKQAQFGQRVLDAADGALTELAGLLTDLNGLVVQSAQTAGRSPSEREADQTEADSILQAIDYLINNTTFNGKRILLDPMGFQSGDTYIAVPSLNGVHLGAVYKTQPMPRIDPNDPSPPPPPSPPSPIALSLSDLGQGRALNLVDGDHELAQQSVKDALRTIGGMQASIGALSRFTLGAQTDVSRIELENTIAAESKIVDADYAAEVVSLIRAQTLTEASIVVIQMAQRNEQHALQLLQ